MGEIYIKEIPGYNGQYVVYSDGRIWSNPQTTSDGRYLKGRFLKQHIQNSGYYMVQLYRNGNSTNYLVSRLVAEAFCNKPEGCEVVNHIDNNRLNNDYTNLEWTTTSGNINHGVKQGRYYYKKSKEEIDNIILTLEEWEGTQYECAKYLGISTAALSRIKNERTYIFYS
jgi:hypothetical protein